MYASDHDAERDMPAMGGEAEASGAPGWREGRRDFAAPLGGATRGRLVFERGAANVTLHPDPTMTDLCRAHFEGPLPAVRAEGGTVSIRYHSFSFFDWLRYAVQWDATIADVAINPAVPWDVEIRGGVSRINADLRELALRSLHVRGGASRVEIWLPRPEGTVSVDIGGGASNVTLYHPRDVPVRLHVHGGASSLTLDEQHFGAVGGALRLETSGYAGAGGRYEVEIGGGASRLTIEAR
jgi:hypothetical protein